MTERVARSTQDGARWLATRPRAVAILLLLATGRRHGYGVMQALREDPVDPVVLGPGTLYRTVRELEQRGLLRSEGRPDGPSGGPPRRYYDLTPHGRRVLGRHVARLAAVVGRAREAGV